MQTATPQDAETENFNVPTLYSIIPIPSKATKAEEHILKLSNGTRTLLNLLIFLS